MEGIPEVTPEMMANYDKLQDELCDDCKALITKEMLDVQLLLNSRNPIKKAQGTVKLTTLVKTLWLKICPECLGKIRKEAGV